MAVGQRTMNDDELDWKTTFDKRYEISNTGLVRNRHTGRVLKNSPSTTGYARVSLSNGRGAAPRILFCHREVARLFIPNPDNKPQVNHIDSNRMNPSASNLEWVTAKENIAHAIKSGNLDPKVHTDRAREKSIQAISIEVEAVNANTGEVHAFSSISACSRSLNLPMTSLKRNILTDRPVRGYVVKKNGGIAGS